MAMTKRKRREPRPPTPGSTLPASFADAEEASIIATVDHDLIVAALGTEAGHHVVQNDLYRQLLAGTAAALDVAQIVAMADGGHAPADHALRTYIHDAIDRDCFADLPLQVRAYGQRALCRPPLPIGYASRSKQVVNDFTRDLGIGVLVDQIVARWPGVPKLYSSSRHSAAWLVALVFTRCGTKLSEQQVRRLYNARATLARRLAEFMLTTNLPFGEAPFGR
jgi:hypothetical protein